MINEEVQEPGAGPVPEGPGREELASAADVISALVRAAKGLRMYLPNNPVLIKFIEELHGRMTLHLAAYGDFELEVDPFALRYRGAEVYQNQDPKESLAFRMHSDGIRVLLLSRGVSQQELTDFLEIAGFERPFQNDDDIVTRLWGAGLIHVAYLLEEDFAEIGALEAAGRSRPPQQDALAVIHRALESGPLPLPRLVPRQLLMLTPDESTWLRKAIQADALRNPLDDVINILSAILAGVQDRELFEDFCAIMAKLAVDMFLAQETGQALRLVRFMDQLQTLGSMGPERRRVLAGALAGMLSEGVLQAVLEAVDSGEALSHDELRELLVIFGLPSLGSICELLGRTEKLKTRKVVMEVLIELGKQDPGVFAPFLSDPRWYLVRNVVLVLSHIGDSAALKMIVGLVSHKEPRVRKEVLGYLERAQDHKAKPYLLKFLRDESSSLRIRALRALAREKAGFAFKPVLSLTVGEEFKTRVLAEKKAVYEALGELGGEQTVPLFRDLLLKKHWFKRALSRESVICAVAGLMKVRHRSAQLLLLEARAQGNPELVAIIDQAAEGAPAVSAGIRQTVA